MKKPFKETAFGRLLNEKLPDAAKIVGDVLPEKGVFGIVKNIISGSQISSEDKEALLREANNFEMEIYGMEIQDRESARAREIALKDTIGIWVQNVCASATIIAFLGLLFGVVFMKVEVQNKELVYTLIGLLGGIVGSIFNYWFGSSQGSSKRNDQMIDMLNKKGQ